MKSWARRVRLDLGLILSKLSGDAPKRNEPPALPTIHLPLCGLGRVSCLPRCWARSTDKMIAHLPWYTQFHYKQTFIPLITSVPERHSNMTRWQVKTFSTDCTIWMKLFIFSFHSICFWIPNQHGLCFNIFLCNVMC